MHAEMNDGPDGNTLSLSDMLDRSYLANQTDDVVVEGAEAHLTGRELLTAIDRMRRRLQSWTPDDGNEPVIGVVTGVPAVALITAHAALAEGWAFSIRSREWPQRYREAAEACCPAHTVSEAEVLALADGSDGHPQPARRVPDILLSHVLYTSGSTGAPRAIATERRALAHHFRVLGSTLRLGPSDVVLQMAPTHLDASLRDLLFPTLTGARIVAGRRIRQRADIAGMATQIVTRGVTHILSALPSSLAEIAAQLSERQVRAEAVHQIAVSGERLTPSIFAAVREAFPNADLVNQYGPSETTMTATRRVIASDQQDASGGTNVGLPYDGYEVRAAEDEIVIAGPGVARSYMGEPRATALAFRPAQQGAGRRKYMTGDVGATLGDGTITLSGRRDDQVKVLGHKFSVTAVSTALENLDPVRRAATIWLDPEGTPPRLAAFVVADAVTPSDLQQRLADDLPSWMLPNEIHRVDALPTLQNGKLDRRALLAMRESPAEAEEEAALSPPEALRQIWARLLGRPDLRVDDDFFLMGGNSLLALKAIAESKRIAPELTVRSFFLNPTVNGVLETCAE